MFFVEIVIKIQRKYENIVFKNKKTMFFVLIVKMIYAMRFEEVKNRIRKISICKSKRKLYTASTG